MAISARLTENIRNILQLRRIVAALGERTTPPWWRTQFLSEFGVRALTRVFPRTSASAALNSVLIAAREDHDKRIGIGGRHHLFRLPARIHLPAILLMSQQPFPIQTHSAFSNIQ